MLDLDGARLLVLGVGVAGESAARAARELGARVTTVDATREADLDSVDGLDLGDFDHVMASPGYAPHSPEVRAVLAAGLRPWSEMEFAWRVRRPEVPWVMVTGTNGKTTTTQMTGAIAAAAGMDVAVCGNMGVPVIDEARREHDLLAVEIASLQLHFSSTISPVAAVCLNADEDHLDWHGGVEEYRADKARVYRHAQAACVYPAHDPVVEAMVRGADVVEGCRAVGVTLGSPAVSQLGLVDGVLVDRAFLAGRQREAVELATLADLGHLVAGDVPPYLASNALAAAGLARAAGAPPEAVRDGLRAFALDKHRTAHVATIDGVAYVDDSKATNAHAARAALAGLPDGTAVWIAGGLAKGQEFDSLVRQVRSKLRAVVLVGVDQGPWEGALRRHAPGIPVTAVAPGETVMERAVDAARSLAVTGDTVLLSPACASMDQFRDYADRGDQFAAAVRERAAEEG